MTSCDHLYLLDGSYNCNSNSEMVSSDLDYLQFFSDPFSPLQNSPPPPTTDDILQQISSVVPNQQFNTDPLSNPFNFSPPSHELNNLSIHNETQFQSLPNSGFYSDGGITDLSSALNNKYNSSGVKLENCSVGFDSSSSSSSSSSYSITLAPGNAFNSEKMMQRSFSSHSLDQKPAFNFQPRFNSLLEVPNFPTQILGSPENTAFTDAAMRRVSSTGDLQKFKRTLSSHGFSSTPLAAENSSIIEEINSKAKPYNAEERKQRINRYRNKRTQRNFNKAIKYVCRKTLADSRPRVRGRFAHNEEISEIPKVTNFNREDDDEDYLWVEKFYEDQENLVHQGGGDVLHQSFIPAQFQ